MEDIVEGYSLPMLITRKSRTRPLHTCGYSVISIADRAYTIAEPRLHGPVGSLAKVLAKLACPVLCTLLSQWLAILSYLDDQILAFENLVEVVFPYSAHVFDKIDAVVYIVEALPMKLGKADNEKEIMVDMNYSSEPLDSEENLEVPKEVIGNENKYESSVSHCSVGKPTNVDKMSMVKPQGRGKDKTVKKVTICHENECESIAKRCSVERSTHVDVMSLVKTKGREKDEEAMEKDRILELFAEAWYM